MNTILLTSGTESQRGGVPQATVQLRLPEDSGGSYLKQPAAGARLETALFIAVQGVMIACIVTVAAQLFATV